MLSNVGFFTLNRVVKLHGGFQRRPRPCSYSPVSCASLLLSSVPEMRGVSPRRVSFRFNSVNGTGNWRVGGPGPL